MTVGVESRLRAGVPQPRFLDMGGGSGPTVNFTKHKIVMKKDINNWPDSTAQTYECPTSGYGWIYCSDRENIPHNVGDWYYIQQNFRGTWGSGYYGDFQIQTRRAKVEGQFGNERFDAYDYGG